MKYIDRVGNIITITYLYKYCGLEYEYMWFISMVGYTIHIIAAVHIKY